MILSKSCLFSDRNEWCSFHKIPDFSCSHCVKIAFYSAFVWKCIDMCKHRFGVQLLENPPLCRSTILQLPSHIKHAPPFAQAWQDAGQELCSSHWPLWLGIHHLGSQWSRLKIAKYKPYWGTEEKTSETFLCVCPLGDNAGTFDVSSAWKK
jgi:hypothetical protein